jgi:RimJ/RimL family protein N-acetyltransferase
VKKLVVKLSFYIPEYIDILREFHLPSGQKDFTALPVNALQKCSHDKERHPVVIFSDDTLVGFFVLHTGSGITSFTNNPHAMLIRALSINYVHQGKGFAKRAMKILPEFVAEHFPSINEITLAVNEKR